MQTKERAPEEALQADSDWVDVAKQMMRIEAEAIGSAAGRLDASFSRALDILDECAGKVVVTGVGKSGMAARKIAATLTSTGCAAVFLHPSEAMHGDLGIVAPEDVVIALSNSGESEELLAILPALVARAVPIVSILGNPDSTLAQKSRVCLDASVEREACPLNLAPTTSVVVALALGDALAMTLQQKRGFRPEDYALNHPGGRLGRRLTMRVRDLMAGGPEALPAVALETTLQDVLSEITAKRMGATCVVDAAGALCGIITDYDFRRSYQLHGADSAAQTAAAMMNPKPALVLEPDQLAFEALQLMEDRPRPLSVAPVVDSSGRCVGMVHIHDMIRAGL